jgi:hypothetical protein
VSEKNESDEKRSMTVKVHNPKHAKEQYSAFMQVMDMYKSYLCNMI